MNMSTFKAKVKEKKEQAVDYLRCHWKCILLGAVFVGAGIAIYASLAEEDTEAGEVDAAPIDYEPHENAYTYELDFPETIIVESQEPSEAAEPKRPYVWCEDSHPVREHTRHNADGSESQVRAYIKVTGGKSVEDDHEYEEDVA